MNENTNCYDIGLQFKGHFILLPDNYDRLCGIPKPTII